MRGRPALMPRLALFLVMAGILAFPTTGLAAVEESHALHDDGARGAIEYLAERWGVRDEAEARLRLDMQWLAVNLKNELYAKAPEALGGVWLDQRDGTVFVAVTDDANETAQELVSRFPHPDRIETVPAAKSLDELKSQLDEALLSLLLDESLRHMLVGAYVAESANRVVIRVAPEAVDAVREHFEDQSLAEGLLVIPAVPSAGAALPWCNEPAVGELWDRRSCENLRGGLRILRTSTSFCSVGFNARTTSGTYYIMTAGHCGGDGVNWKHGLSFSSAPSVGPQSLTHVGEPVASIVAGNLTSPDQILGELPKVDAARIRVSGAEFINEPSRWVYAGFDRQAYQMHRRANVFVSIDTPYDIETQEAWTATPGSIICRSGYTTFEQCGTVITDTAYSLVNQDEDGWVAYSNQVYFTACIRGGDSGGSIYGPVGSVRHSLAIGLATAGPDVEGTLPCGLGGDEAEDQFEDFWNSLPQVIRDVFDFSLMFPDEYTYGSRIRNVESELGLVIITGS